MINKTIYIKAEDLVANLTYLYTLGAKYAVTDVYTYELEKLIRVLR